MDLQDLISENMHSCVTGEPLKPKTNEYMIAVIVILQ